MNISLTRLLDKLGKCQSVIECSNYSNAVANILRIRDHDNFVDVVISSIIPPASRCKLNLLFDDDFETGTFCISERLSRPSFISSADNLPFKVWVYKNVHAELLRLERADGSTFLALKKKEQRFQIHVEDFVFLCMFLVSRNTHRMLIELVPNQLYQDVFTKLIAYFIFGDVNKYPYVEREYNESVEKVSLSIVKHLSGISLLELLKYSIAAGSLGVDLKSSASAASPIHKSINNIIFYNFFENEGVQERVIRIENALANKVKEELAIDFWQQFKDEFVDTKELKTLVWFHDDVAETVFDLYLIQKLLLTNDKLTVVSIPRSGKYGIRFGNDASSMDIERYLTLSVFSELNLLFKSGRYQYSDEGPCWGAVHGLQLSENVVNLMLNSSAILVKGSRSYEMLQGIKIPAYFASMVCRDFSESIFDVDAELGTSIFLKQEAGLPSFQGFKVRERRIRQLPSGRNIMLCAMTAQEYAKAINHENYAKIAKKFGDLLEANLWIKREAQRNNLTIAEFILGYGA